MDQTVGVLSLNEIKAAIPENTEPSFEVMGRKVNLEHSKANPELYSIIRSWVRDNPDQSLRPPSINQLWKMKGDRKDDGKPQSQNANSAKDPNECESMECQDNEKPNNAESVDVVSRVRQQREKPEIQSLSAELVSRSRKARFQNDERRAARAKIAAVKLSLHRKGIKLPSKHHKF